MPESDLGYLRRRIDRMKYADESAMIAELVELSGLSPQERDTIHARAVEFVRHTRGESRPTLMEAFLAEYGLSTVEGVALMCLAEAMLRIPDAKTIDALIEDKIVPSDWGKHLGHSSSSLVNASTWALMLTGRMLDDCHPGIAGALHGLIKQLGEPMVRKIVIRAMHEMGNQFVLGQNIEKAMSRARIMEARGYFHSYDMLGEAARTDADAQRYFESYINAIEAIASACRNADIRCNPGISVKLSALHPRFEESQRDRILRDLPPRLLRLARLAKSANMGLNIDAEEADRLALSLDVAEATLRDMSLAGWDGFGFAVQVYGQRAGPVLDWLYGLAEALDRRLMVRLVKGAYWDTEIKLAHVKGVDGFPVFTSKSGTDISYIANARRLLLKSDRLFAQFATHNAHTVAAILHLAGPHGAFEFQRLHGMGERLHQFVREVKGRHCRIYAPVGENRDLLAYLVRRLLENGTNSSFVNQITNEDIPPETVAADPFESIGKPSNLPSGPDLFRPERRNSKGWDIEHRPQLDEIESGRSEYADSLFTAIPILQFEPEPGTVREVRNPAKPNDLVGEVREATLMDVQRAIESGRPWNVPAAGRAGILNQAADFYEADAPRLFALLAREAGKTLSDAVGEVREAVDFLRFYASNAQDCPAAQGLFTCISPWNFPLAIFTGQVAGALASGNGVLAKPAEQTPLIAHAAVSLLHRAGVPRHALQFLPGDGPSVGGVLTSDRRVTGVAFTGSSNTARMINCRMAECLDPGIPFIAETGGINAMIVDSTALPEQAVRDVIQSAFQSAGQRCSALRCLYVQDVIADDVMEMLFGAMDTLVVGDPWEFATDVGPVINAEAKAELEDYLKVAKASGTILKQLKPPRPGSFVGPTVIKVNGIREVEREVFGPVLHLTTFDADRIDTVLEDIANSGYGLTFGLHTRIDSRVQEIIERLPVGNIYVNRNQIGAVVGSQPFGGEGLSGTGPKAGGPFYLSRFNDRGDERTQGQPGNPIDANRLQVRIDATPQSKEARSVLDMPGPTGESNRLSFLPRVPLLCLGPGREAVAKQIDQVTRLGGVAVAVPEAVEDDTLAGVSGISGVVWWGDRDTARGYAKALASRPGPILRFVTGTITRADVLLERHVCVDSTASGGNVALLAEVSSH